MLAFKKKKKTVAVCLKQMKNNLRTKAKREREREIAIQKKKSELIHLIVPWIWSTGWLSSLSQIKCQILMLWALSIVMMSNIWKRWSEQGGSILYPVGI